MFNKKNKCICGKKVDKKFKFCPYCGEDISKKIDYDEEIDKQTSLMIQDFEKAFNMPFFVKFPFEKLVKKMVKEIDKQFHDYDNYLAKQKSPDAFTSGISISIDSTQGGEPVIKVRQFGPGKDLKIRREKIPEKEAVLPKKIKEKDMEKFSKLPRQEPETTVRRLTDKIVYEISLPGVINQDNILINKLQNSIEIKAFSKDKAYFKLIPISLPIKNWKLEHEKLILELSA